MSEEAKALTNDPAPDTKPYVPIAAAGLDVRQYGALLELYFAKLKTLDETKAMVDSLKAAIDAQALKAAGSGYRLEFRPGVGRPVMRAVHVPPGESTSAPVVSKLLALGVTADIIKASRTVSPRKGYVLLTQVDEPAPAE